LGLGSALGKKVVTMLFTSFSAAKIILFTYNRDMAWRGKASILYKKKKKYDDATNISFMCV